MGALRTWRKMTFLACIASGMAGMDMMSIWWAVAVVLVLPLALLRETGARIPVLERNEDPDWMSKYSEGDGHG